MDRRITNVDQKKRNKFDGTMFSAEEAAKYDTIRKAIMKVVSQDSSAKPYTWVVNVTTHVIH